jgi:hypothetical protein
MPKYLIDNFDSSLPIDFEQKNNMKYGFNTVLDDSELCMYSEIQII